MVAPVGRHITLPGLNRHTGTDSFIRRDYGIDTVIGPFIFQYVSSKGSIEREISNLLTIKT